LAFEIPGNQGSCPNSNEGCSTVPHLFASDPQKRTSVRRQQDQDNLQQMLNTQQMINDQQMQNDQMFQQQQQQMINDMNNR